MFTSKNCFRHIPYSQFRIPLFTDWSELGWRKILLLVILISLVIFAISWIIRNEQARHWLRQPKTFIVLFCITVSIPILYTLALQGLVAFLPKDTGKTTQAIVVLGRGGPFEDSRIDATVELWQEKRAPNIFVSGFVDAQTMIPKIEKKGVPDRAVDGESCSRTTWENALFSAAILQPQKIQKILLVTDAPHMWRSLLLFRANGFSVIPYTVPLPPLGLKSKVLIVFREYMGLIGYSFQGLFDPKHSPKIDSPDLEKLIQAAKKYGQQKRLN